VPTLHILGYNLYHFDINTKKIMDEYLTKIKIETSDYTFVANYLWLSSASGFYAIINDTFCLFIMQGGQLSMLLPPLGEKESISKAILECFSVMDENNFEQGYSKIEYVHEEFLEFLQKDRYQALKSSDDYLYRCEHLIELKGNNYHTKRNEINKFKKMAPIHSIAKIDLGIHKESILKLYGKWVSDRAKNLPKDDDRFLEGMFYEQRAIQRLLNSYHKLDVIGIGLFVEDELRGFTFGEKINGSVASVIIEKCDIDLAGSAAFIFREFCRVLRDTYGVEYINVGDDMGFENLKRAKMSYHPSALIAKYTISELVC
jgi:hypothetical protein